MAKASRSRKYWTMKIRTPDTWVVLRFVSIKNSDEVFYRLLSGWTGGWAQSDEWRLNSGITKMEDAGTYWIVRGGSGSVYHCHKECYRLTSLTSGLYAEWQNELGAENIQVMPEDTDWTNVNWGLTDA